MKLVSLNFSFVLMEINNLNYLFFPNPTLPNFAKIVLGKYF